MANTDTLDALDRVDEWSQRMRAGNVKDQMVKDAVVTGFQEELLNYEPEELIAELNAESEATGVYGFEYLQDASGAADIPGMTAVSYQIPDDPNGGVYVGYESYEQTYQKAQADYQEIIAGGGVPTEDEELAYQEATRRYAEQKDEYDMYREDNPGAPDYLTETNPVESYAAFEIPRLEAEATAKYGMDHAAESVSMDDVEAAMKDGKTGTLRVGSAAASGRYSQEQSQVEAESVSSSEYVARITDEIDATTIMGMNHYQSSAGAELPEVTSSVGTDEYGQEVVERLKVIDEELSRKDGSYESAFPSGMRYYADGENPQAIPGMTLVVGKIEGAPGFYAGYETYDETYKNALSELDAESLELEAMQDDPNADMNELVERQESNQAGYTSANEIYDMQKEQYGEYVEKNPGNDFIGKDSPVDEFNNFQKDLPVQQQTKNKFAGLKEWFKEQFEKLKNGLKILGAKISGQKDDGLTAEAAQVSNEEYWAKRAEMNPEDESVQEKYQAMTDTKLEPGMSAESSVVSSGNKFRDIVQNGMSQPDMDYQYQHNMSASAATYGMSGSTGNQLLDELSMGSTGTVDSMVENMPDSRTSAMDMDTLSDTELQQTARSERRLPNLGNMQVQTEKSAENSGARSSSVSERLAALNERLAAGAAAQQQDAQYNM